MPFVQSVENVFGTMLQLPVRFGQPRLKEPGKPSFHVSGIIGMSGDVEGAVVVSFPLAAAERVVQLFTGESLTSQHADFADAIGELVNMISGGAKAKFPAGQVNISCPSVVIGPDHTVHTRKDVTCVIIPCECDCGEFAVEVAFKRTAQAAPAGQGSMAAVA
jgi:chemotaxis protein CheX